MLLNSIRDEWLVSRQAVKLFIAATLLVLALTAMFGIMIMCGVENTNGMPFMLRLPIGILAIAGTMALFFVWLGMWRFWLRIDSSGKAAKRLWFGLLLLGFWYASCLYVYAVYLPQASRARRLAG
jgi:hypothetical protein